ncbi:uncharacterized protein LOC133911644 [Phragmites australis]|uniref:uncharacterized protein LOC133911644 n=1 Tax=Phragmites australis TaxID=29695 RepID=UPI002D7A1CB7|nr:uncharacterized protein LOC133911644 [Phragmites australis]
MLSSDDFLSGGIIAAAVLAILLVALSTYGRRRCRHPALRFFVWSASTVFLPLTSSIISTLLRRSSEPRRNGSMPPTGKNNPDIQNMWTLLLWIVLILTIRCNADIAAAAVATAAASPAGGDVSVDGQRIRPPVEHFAQYAWVAYLIWICVPLGQWLRPLNIAIFVAFSALGLAKTVLKLAAFWSASRSFALGKNARLIAGYMAQLVTDASEGHNPVPVPRYIVMGERTKHVEECPEGYRVKRDVLEDQFSGLVTLDRVWRLAEHGDGILAERHELRDLCLSYSLFKNLRRRLSGYPLADAGSGEALDFVGTRITHTHTSSRKKMNRNSKLSAMATNALAIFFFFQNGAVHGLYRLGATHAEHELHCPVFTRRSLRFGSRHARAPHSCA